jgi:hypothetical protein
VRVGGESVPARERLGDVAEQLAGYLGHGTAVFADQMPVRGRGEVVGGGAAAQMGPVDDAEPDEFVEVAVDGADVHRRCLGPDLFGEFLGAAVGAVPE